MFCYLFYFFFSHPYVKLNFPDKVHWRCCSTLLFFVAREIIYSVIIISAYRLNYWLGNNGFYKAPSVTYEMIYRNRCNVPASLLVKLLADLSFMQELFCGYNARIFAGSRAISEMIKFPDRDSLKFPSRTSPGTIWFFAKAASELKFPSHGPSC